MADGEVIISIDGDDSGLKEKLNGIGKIGASAAKVISGAFTVAGSALTAAGGYALKVGSDFEASMSKVQAISGATGDELEQLKAKAKEMGSTTKFSATESAEALQYMAMAGWKTEQMVNGLPGIMNLAAASGEDLATTSDIVTDALTAFGMQASDSGRFADILAAASSNANTNVGMMGETFKYVAPVAGALGYSAEDTAVAIGLMANAGIKASQAGTSLKTALANMAAPTKDMAAAMGQYNISLTNSDGTMKSLDEVMQNLRSSLGGLSETEQTAAASTIFGKDAMAGMLAIINASDGDFSKLTDAINDSSGAAEQMAAVMNDNLQGAIVIAQSGLEGLGISVYESLETPLKEAVQTATGMISQLQSAFDAGGLFGLVNAFGTVAADAITQLAGAAPQMIDAASMLIVSFANGVAANSAQIGTAVLGIGAALANGVITIAPTLLNMGLQIVTAIGGAIIEQAPTMLTAATGLLQNLASGIAANLPQLIPAALSMLTQITSGLREGAGQLVDGALAVVTAIGGGIIDSLPALIESVPQIVTNIASIVNDNAPKLVTTAAELLGKLGKGLIQAIPTLAANIPQIVQAIAAALMAFNWVNLGKTVITMLKNGITAMANAAQGAGTKILNAVNSGLKALPSKLLSLGRSGIQGMISGIQSLFSNASGAMQNLGTLIVNAVKALPGKLLTIGRQIIQGLINGIKAGATGVVAAIGGVVNSAIEKAKGLLGIHSPSRVFREQVGRMLAMGMALGIEDGERAVHAAVLSMSQRAYELAKEDASDFKEIGTLYMESLTYGVEAGRDAAIARMDQWIAEDCAAYEKKLDAETNALIEAKQARMKKVSEVQKKALQAEVEQLKTDTAAKKKAYQEAGNEVANTYKTALTDGYTDALNAVKAKMTAITEEAQKQRDAVLSDQQAMLDKLAGFGDLFRMDDNILTLGDMEKNVKAVEQYDAALTALQERGVSQDFMSKVTALGVEQGMEFAEKLAKLPEDAFEKYIGAWEEQQTLAKAVAEKFYADQLESINTEFTDKMEQALESVPNMLDDVGKDSIQGMINGMYSKSGALSTAASEIVRRAINAMREAADIHSPSKQTAKLVGAPLAQGVGVGFDKVYPQIAAKMRSVFDATMAQTSARLQSAAAVPRSTTTHEITNNTTTVDRILRLEVGGDDGEFVRWLRKKIKSEDKRTGMALV